MKPLEILSNMKMIVLLAVATGALALVIFFIKGDLQILDTKFFYLKSEIQPLFMLLGEDGRQVYQKINLIDFAFMISYTLLFIGIYFSFFKNLAKSLIAVPLSLFLVDVVETSIIYHLLNIFPETHNGLEYALMLLTPFKWMLALSALLVVINGYFVNLYIRNSK